MDLHTVDQKATAYRRHLEEWRTGTMYTTAVDVVHVCHTGASQKQPQHLPTG